ncbi:MAG: hypothetical protein ACJZ2J_01830 [Candidatus Poseidoniales archaeon]
MSKHGQQNDREFLQLPISEGLNVVSGNGIVGPTNTLTLETEIFENETRISGMPTFHVDVNNTSWANFRTFIH